MKRNQFQCLSCNFSCNDNQQVRLHLASHRGCRASASKNKVGSGYSCRHCQYKAVSEKDIIAHLNHHSNNNSVYWCEFCHKTFSSEIQHKFHRAIHLQQQQSFNCSDCAKQFCNIIALNEHKITHQKNKE